MYKYLYGKKYRNSPDRGADKTISLAPKKNTPTQYI
jgi:hypothetical protein